MAVARSLLILSACSGQASSPAAVESPPQGVAAPLPGVPHGQAIVLVATTDAGDAACTVDAGDQVRIWPSLDGKHEPVMLRTSAPRDLALARTPDGLLAAVLDDAGGLEAIRLDANGAVRGRTRFAPEPGFDEIEALGDGVLARRRDQVLVWFDATGAERATLAARPGEHVRTIATRGALAIAGLAVEAPQQGPGDMRAPEIDRVRVIDTQDGLAWGDVHALAAPFAGMLALSPSGTRIAGLRASDAGPVITELATDAFVPIEPTSSRFREGSFLGFTDDDTLLAVDATKVRWWQRTPSGDPWDVNFHVEGSADTIAVGGGRAIAASSAGLALVDPQHTRYLGYRQIANGVAQTAGELGAIASPTRVTWFDRELHEREGRGEAATERAILTAIGERYVARTQPTLDAANPDAVYLDGPAGPPIELGAWPQVRAITYEPRTRIIAIATIEQAPPNAVNTVIHRFELDVDAGSVRPLRALRAGVVAGLVTPLDPERSGGYVAIALDSGAAPAIVRFHEDWQAARDRVPTAPLIGSVTRLDGEGTALGADAAGNAYFLRAGTNELAIQGVDNAWRSVHVGVTDRLAELGGAVASDGAVVLYDQHRLIALAADGSERWRVEPPSRLIGVAFLADGKTLLLSSSAGLVSIDRASGAQIAKTCAFGFGLFETATLEAFSEDNLCSDD